MRSSVSPGADPVPFDVIKATRGNRWNPSTHTFNITEAAGLYFVSLNVGVPTNTQANYMLTLSGRKFGGITRTSDIQNGSDVISHDILVSLYAADTLHVSSEQPVYSCCGQFDTSLSIFSLTNTIVNEAAAFSVARDDTVSANLEPFPFNIYLYNSGFHYHPLSHTYTAPFAGIYYFSFSVGLAAHGTADFGLYKNFEPYVNILRTSTRHNGTDTIGRAVMMRLEQGDMIYMVNEAGQTARSSPMMETSFSGFQYLPKHGNMVKKM